MTTPHTKYGHLINRYITHYILFQQIAQPSDPDVIQAIVQVILSHPISYPFVPLHSPGTSIALSPQYAHSHYKTGIFIACMVQYAYK